MWDWAMPQSPSAFLAQMWFTPAGGSWRSLIPSPLAGFPGRRGTGRMEWVTQPLNWYPPQPRQLEGSSPDSSAHPQHHAGLHWE